MLTHVRFLAIDGHKLAGLLYWPTTKTKKVAIYLHGNGYGSIFESVEKMDIFASALNKNDIAFFPFNNRGSNMVRKLKRDVNGIEEETKGGTAYELIKDCVKDIDGAIEYLKTHGFEEFYLIGESTGANKICVYNYYKKAFDISKAVLLRLLNRRFLKERGVK
jgi:predicted alpha/beta hydrolase